MLLLLRYLPPKVKINISDRNGAVGFNQTIGTREMITKAVMIIWIWAGNGQEMVVTDFDSLADCEAAKAALIQSYDGWFERDLKNARCIPYMANPIK